jgi:peptide/nickel transport system permease protein
MNESHSNDSVDSKALSLEQVEELEHQKSMEKVKTMGEMVWEQFRQHTLALGGFICVLIFIVVGLCAPLISYVTNIDPNAQNVFFRYKAPFTTIPYTDELKSKYLGQLSLSEPEKFQGWIQTIGKNFPDEFVIGENESKSDFLISVLDELENNSDFQERFLKVSETEKELNEIVHLKDNMNTFHVLGTDELGRDVFLRLLYGTRVSIGIGVIVAFAAALIGLLIGALSGYYGGILDSVLMRFTDALLSLPLLPVLIVVAAIDFRKIPLMENLMGTESESIFKLIFILCLFSWMTVARLVRGSILSIKERDFVGAAKTLGAKDSTIILRHLVPNTIAPLLVAVTLNIGSSILSEAALSFLGLGIQPPVASWGNMLFNAQELIYEAPIQAILPGLLILLVVVSFNFIGDGLQDAIDPRSIKR